MNIYSFCSKVDCYFLNKIYLDKRQLKVNLLGRGYAWLDSGTHDSLLETSSFVKTIQKSQDVLVGSPEEAAFLNGWIGKKEIEDVVLKNNKNHCFLLIN